MSYYTFVSLTPAQLEERRTQLDLAGFHAWLAPIILLVTIWIYRQLRRRGLNPSLLTDKASLSPNVSQRPPSRVQVLLRRLHWVLNTTYMGEFGPFHVQLIGLGYFCWLLYLVFRATGNDYMHLTKSFGHVAISQLPMHYLLALKSPQSPITLATGLTHERLNAFHRLFGRMIHVLLGAHAVLYLGFFVKLGLLAKRVRDLDVQLGLSAFWVFNALALLALPAVRRRLYHSVFYRSHVVLSAVVLPLLFFHVPYTRVYVAQAAVFWILGGLLRQRGSETVSARSELLDGAVAATGSQLVSVRFTVGAWSPLAHAKAGQHVYIRHEGLLGPKNPFTIANVHPINHAVEDEDEKLQDGKAAQPEVEVQLVLRNTGGPQTSYLSGLAQKQNKRPSKFALQVEGPYGESEMYIPRLLKGQHTGTGRGPILLIAGGVGVTYTLPIYMALLASQRTTTRPGSGSGSGNGNDNRTKMIWLVKTLAAAQWGITILNQAQDRGDIQPGLDLDIYITLEDATPAPSRPMKAGIRVHRLGHRPDLESVIDTALAVSSVTEKINSSYSSSGSGVDLGNTVRRRVQTALNQQQHHHHQEVTVFLCGPSSLARDVRDSLGKHISEGVEVNVFEELFGFGGG
ncbi:hypothetical protein A1O3_08189 [Capronia epimyces CBS 606.96]|uniref:FAD-binding FR-type domain-containing protein n=1 Tax=Capronia epimyces CBS 606.96 TaxID=1182542 RepID=W9YC54_9EURO|nr:uncharacterized protein A1O3_08189 [Capronia epimyces CBS 606.96]EXJ79904.1 hypothetical protein A1O3_08189 [Capronia epimyces CBS 606.96]